MAFTGSNERIAEGDPLVSRDLLTANKRRASRLPAAEPAGGDEGEVAQPGGQPGRKLTPAQRSALIRIIAIHHYVDAVRDTLTDEQPDFPPISDQLIRYYRQKIESDVLVEASVARAQALRNGLANKSVRVRFLIRMVEQWRRVPLAETTRYFDDDGVETTIYKTREGASREMRELLKQIALELGHLSMPNALNAPPGATEAPNDEDEAIELDLRTDLNELIAEMVDRDRATEAALLAAQRPERE